MRDQPTADPQSEPQDFQSELQKQATGTQDTKPKGRPAKDPGKPEKKNNTPADGQNPYAALPLQVAEPRKQVLPVELALPNSDGQVEVDEQAKPDQSVRVVEQLQAEEHTRRTENPTLPPHAGRELYVASAKAAQITLPEKATEPPQDSSKPEETEPSAPAPPAAWITAENAVRQPIPDAPRVAVPSQGAVVPLRQETVQPEDSTAASEKIEAPPQTQAISREDVKRPEALPAAAPGPAVEESTNRAASNPAALAFAARMTPAPQKTDEPIPETPSQSGTASSDRKSVRIPMRYAGTAQILPQGDSEAKQSDGPKREVFADRPVRPDMVLPKLETAREAAPDSKPAAPPQVSTSARLERILNTPTIEAPSAAPTSARDIRVRVPDNNGGSTQVRFVESGGEVRVSVRTADETLAQNLRSHLHDLTQRLADGGIPSEMWKPGSGSGSPQNDQQADREGRGSGGQESGARNGQQDRQERRPEWLEEMEASLRGKEDSRK